MAGRLSALGWVPQHPTVLAGTVLDNITLGRPGIDERIARAAPPAALGLDALVGVVSVRRFADGGVIL